MKTLSAGKICYLISGQASERASWDGTQITLNVKTDKVGPELDKCAELIDATCTLKTGESSETDLTITDSENFDTTTETAQECKNLKAQKDCTTNCSEKWKGLINFNPLKKENSQTKQSPKALEKKLTK